MPGKDLANAKNYSGQYGQEIHNALIINVKKINSLSLHNLDRAARHH